MAAGPAAPCSNRRILAAAFPLFPSLLRPFLRTPLLLAADHCADWGEEPWGGEKVAPGWELR